MSKRKLIKFAELETFSNVIQLPFYFLQGSDFRLKGKWSQLYFKNGNPVVLELGCGKGEYTLALAEKFPDKNFIGIDIKGSRLWNGSKAALEKKMQNVAFLRTNIEGLNYIFGKNEIYEIWITFPDPYSKRSKANKRLTSIPFLEIYRNILLPGGIIHLKTDNRQLFNFTLEIIKQAGCKTLLCTSDLYNDYFSNEISGIKTYYEKMFISQGAKICYVNFKFN